MSSDNNNNPSSTGGDEFFPLSSRTVNRFVMNSSESTLFAPDTDSNSTNGIYLGLTDDIAEETDEELSTDEVASSSASSHRKISCVLVEYAQHGEMRLR